MTAMSDNCNTVQLKHAVLTVTSEVRKATSGCSYRSVVNGLDHHSDSVYCLRLTPQSLAPGYCAKCTYMKDRI